MSNEERDMIMKAAAQRNGTIVNVEMNTIGEGGGEEEKMSRHIPECLWSK
jgi:hypothetical protein